jgi:hypothetical protein
MSDQHFETKALIQKAINIGLIQRDGSMFRVFGESSSSNTLDGLINFLLDERNNNIRISLIGKIEDFENAGIVRAFTKDEMKSVEQTDMTKKLEEMEKLLKQTIEDNTKLKEQLVSTTVDDKADTEKKAGRPKK